MSRTSKILRVRDVLNPISVVEMGGIMCSYINYRQSSLKLAFGVS